MHDRTDYRDDRARSGFSAEASYDASLGARVISLRHDDPLHPEENLHAAIAPEYGSNLFRLRAGDDDIIFCAPALLTERDWTGTFVLWPLPNRVRDKAFTFAGRRYSLEAVHRKRGNAVLVHGLVDDQAWTHDEPVADADGAFVTTRIAITAGSPLHERFPFESSLTLRFSLSERAIRVAFTVVNDDARELPFGFALHPYFATLSGKDKTYVTLPGDLLMEADEQLLPTGRLLDVTGTPNDLRMPTPVGKL